MDSIMYAISINQFFIYSVQLDSSTGPKLKVSDSDGGTTCEIECVNGHAIECVTSTVGVF